MRIESIELSSMGAPIARRLARSGVAMTGNDVAQAALDALDEPGTIRAANPVAAANEADTPRHPRARGREAGRSLPLAKGMLVNDVIEASTALNDAVVPDAIRRMISWFGNSGHEVAHHLLVPATIGSIKADRMAIFALASWPRARDTAGLPRRSDGFWIYASTLLGSMMLIASAAVRKSFTGEPSPIADVLDKRLAALSDLVNDNPDLSGLVAGDFEEVHAITVSLHRFIRDLILALTALPDAARAMFEQTIEAASAEFLAELLDQIAINGWVIQREHSVSDTDAHFVVPPRPIAECGIGHRTRTRRRRSPESLKTTGIGGIVEEVALAWMTRQGQFEPPASRPKAVQACRLNQLGARPRKIDERPLLRRAGRSPEFPPRSRPVAGPRHRRPGEKVGVIGDMPGNAVEIAEPLRRNAGRRKRSEEEGAERCRCWIPLLVDEERVSAVRRRPLRGGDLVPELGSLRHRRRGESHKQVNETTVE